MRTVEFDASGQPLGRLATQVANALRGKDQPSYRPDRLAEVRVVVKNCRAVKLTGAKANQKLYYNYSGYPGGLKKTAYREMNALHPERVITLAVKRMLPNNRLRDRLMKHLSIET